MTWPQFLAQVSNQVALLGPLLDRPRTLTMPSVFVDGGSDFLKESVALSPRAVPVVSVGDGDSASGALDEKLPERKDFSDLAFVLRALPASVEAVEMFGFLGGRRDHELANFGEVHKFLTDRTALTVVNFHSTSAITVIAFAGGQLELNINGIFSVLVLETAAVGISGDCEYKLEASRSLAPASSLGLSNVGHGRVRFEARAPVFIHLI